MKGSMFDEWSDEIRLYIAAGYNLKEIWRMLTKQGLHCDYNSLYWYCRKHGITANSERVCKNCTYCDTYDVPDFNSKIRVCNKHKCQIRAKIVPRWCNDGFEER